MQLDKYSIQEATSRLLNREISPGADPGGADYPPFSLKMMTDFHKVIATANSLLHEICVTHLKSNVQNFVEIEHFAAQIMAVVENLQALHEHAVPPFLNPVSAPGFLY